MHYKKEKKSEINQTELGTLIDSSDEDFKEAVKKFNIGTLKGLILIFQSVYYDLNSRKNALTERLYNEKDADFNEVKKAVEALFLEMIKTENKLLILNKYCSELDKKTEEDFAKRAKEC